eukprot:737525-Hanusia_phi.AAC.1
MGDTAWGLKIKRRPTAITGPEGGKSPGGKPWRNLSTAQARWMEYGELEWTLVASISEYLSLRWGF